MPTILIQPPADYLLRRDACSYGYFLLAPNHWDPARALFRTTLDLRAPDPHVIRDLMLLRATDRGSERSVRSGPGLDSHTSSAQRGGRSRTPIRGAVTVLVDQPPPAARSSSRAPKPGSPLRIQADRALSKLEAAIVERMLSRMLRLDEPAAHLRAFHTLDPRWKRSGRGRLMRSPTIFEDVVKTVTSCNVAWPSTIVMNQRLCEVLGERSPSGLRAFPTPERLARTKPITLRARCRVGYRDARIVELARLFAATRARLRTSKPLADSHLALPHWESPDLLTDDDLREALLALPGIGPYAAANVLQLLGRYAHLPLDTESVRHGKAVLGFTGSAARIMKRVHAHFAPFGDQAFRSYWFELWAFYESKHGPAWTWERETTGKKFTASQLAD